MRGKKPEGQNIDLGLIISRNTRVVEWDADGKPARLKWQLMRYGEVKTEAEMASFCNCSPWAIQLIKRRGLRKMRIRLAPFLKDCVPEAREFFNAMTAT